jgi:hypothetical protein
MSVTRTMYYKGYFATILDLSELPGLQLINSRNKCILGFLCSLMQVRVWDEYLTAAIQTSIDVGVPVARIYSLIYI